MKRIIAALVVGLVSVASATADEVTTGKIKSVDKDDLVLKGTTKNTRYDVAKDAVIWLDGRACKLGDLKADDRVTVVYTKEDDRFKTKYVRALRSMDEATGAIREVSADKKQVVTKGAVKDATYLLTDDATIWVDGKKGTFKDLRSGDEIRITYASSDSGGMRANDVVVTKRKQ